MLPIALNSASPRHDYLEPDSPEMSAEERHLINGLVATRAFRRLRFVRFLGAIDYVLIPAPNGAPRNIRYTRFQHSLGVLRLAGRYAAYVGLDRKSRLAVYAAALLHDIGHAPLSHSLEPVFKAAFDIDHHRATEDLILGRHRLGADVLSLLRKSGVDPSEVVAVLSGETDPCAGFFSGPINFDTIEGILRTAEYMVSVPSRLEPWNVVASATVRENPADEQVVDEFWRTKNSTYSLIIRSREGVIADGVSQAILRRHLDRFSKQDYFTTERSLFAKVPELRHALSMGLTDAARKLDISLPATYTSRSFFIDASVAFNSWRDDDRYRQTRSVQRLPITEEKAGRKPTQCDLLTVAECP
jgi:HD superfamily phosphohydrolase